MQDPEYFDRWFNREYGAPDVRVETDDRAFEKYSGLLPDDVFDFWRKFRWGCWRRAGEIFKSSGAYCVIDPATLQPTTDRILRTNPQFASHPITPLGYDAFGVIDLWDSQGFYVTLTVVENMVVCRSVSTDARFMDHVADGMEGRKMMENAYHDLVPKAFETAGTLEYGQCYAFSPMLVFDGVMKSPKQFAKLKERQIVRSDIGRNLETLYKAQPPMIYEFAGMEDGKIPIYNETVRLSVPS